MEQAWLCEFASEGVLNVKFHLHILQSSQFVFENVTVFIQKLRYIKALCGFDCMNLLPVQFEFIEPVPFQAGLGLYLEQPASSTFSFADYALLRQQ